MWHETTESMLMYHILFLAWICKMQRNSVLKLQIPSFTMMFGYCRGLDQEDGLFLHVHSNRQMLKDGRWYLRIFLYVIVYSVCFYGPFPLVLIKSPSFASEMDKTCFLYVSHSALRAECYEYPSSSPPSFANGIQSGK